MVTDELELAQSGTWTGSWLSGIFVREVPVTSYLFKYPIVPVQVHLSSACIAGVVDTGEAPK